MKTAYLEDADQAAVAAAVADLIRARGGLVTEATHSHVRFEGLNPGREYSFSKGGYVGVYHHVGEKEVELRLRVEASVPARIFWWTVLADLVGAILLFVLGPSGSVWVSLGALMYAAFLAALLLYVGTFRSTWHVERELFQEFLDRVRELPNVRGGVETREERAEREFNEAVEGELAARAVRAERKAQSSAPKPAKERRALKVSLPFARKPAPPAESPEEKRARLARLREEIERRKGGG